MKYIEWSDIWVCILLACALFGIGLIGRAITADHTPKFYFVSMETEKTPCVRAWEEWAGNPTVFCSEDVLKDLGVMDRLNASLKARKPSK